MQKVIDIILKLVENGIFKTLEAVCSAVKSVFSYLNRKQDIKEKEKIEKIEKDAESRLDDACEKGDIKNLIDAAENMGEIRRKSR